MIGTVLKLGTLAFIGGVFSNAMTGPWPGPMRSMPVADFYRSDQRPPAALHTIPWYIANDAERTATLRWCHESSERGRMPDCGNADRATAGAWMKRQKTNPLSFMDDPEYWRRNPWGRHATLEACKHPERPGNDMELPYCRIARQVEAEGR